VTKQLLNASKIGPAFEQVGGCAMPQTVRSHGGRPRHFGYSTVYQRPDRPLVQPAAADAEEESRAARRTAQSGSGRFQPVHQRARRGDTHRHGALAVSFAENAHHPATKIDVVDVEVAQLAYSYPGGIEQLEHRLVTYGNRIRRPPHP